MMLRSPPRSTPTHAKVLQASRYDVCANLVPLDDEASMLRVSPRRSTARPLVEAAVDLLRRQREPS